jgi:hypothetical protein
VLSNMSVHQPQLFHGRIKAWNLERSIQPPPQVAIGPGRLELEKLKQEQGNLGGPNLDLHRILTGAHKRLDLEMLLQGLEKEFDLPALLR